MHQPRRESRRTRRPGQHSLIWVANRGDKACVELLISRKADVNHASPDGGFALLGAASGGHQEVCEMLLKAGAGKSMTDRAGQTAAQRARANGKVDVAAFIESWGLSDVSWLFPERNVVKE